MQMLEDLESGELEKRYSPIQLWHVNEYLATLAKEGTLPDEFDEETVLEEDIEDLMFGENSTFQLANYFENSNEYMIIPAVLNNYSGYNIVQCGKISRGWKKTKKFAKKHKKAIIIGAVVVVAVPTIAVAVIAASSASAASATAGAAGIAAGVGSGSSDSSYSEPKKTEPGEPYLITDTNESPAMKAAIDEHIFSFKEYLVEDKAVQQTTPFKEWDEMSFREKAREVGANVAHQAFDEVTDLVKVVPELCKEVKELGSKFLPESHTSQNIGAAKDPIENYTNLVSKGHETIDKVFSTDQAEFFTVEARANDPMNNFAIGLIPLPSEIPSLFSSTSKLIRNGNIMDRGQFTKVGRGLTKHGYRKGSSFPKPLGNPAQINAQGQQVLESILNHPERTYIIHETRRLGKTVDIFSPECGARFSLEGEFIGFLEPRRKKI